MHDLPLSTIARAVICLRMTCLDPTSRACGLHVPARPAVCVALGGHYFFLQQRWWRHSGTPRKADGTGARGGSWARGRERTRHSRHRAPCVLSTLGTAPAGRVGMSGRSVERRIRDPVSCRESLYITFRPPVHSVAALVRVGRVSAIAPNPTCTLLLTPCTVPLYRRNGIIIQLPYGILVR